MGRSKLSRQVRRKRIMEDLQIIQLFFDRSEEAIAALSDKFGRYCSSIARNILGNAADTEECVNDALLHVWNSIPPKRPDSLKAYVGRITRNLALDAYDKRTTQKRGGGQVALALDELTEVVGKDADPAQHIEAAELSELINNFLATLPEDKRVLFMKRYWYLDSVRDIAIDQGMSEANVKTTLFRIREQLKAALAEEGFEV